MLLSQHLFYFGHSKMSQMVCCYNHLAVEACGYNDPVYSENPVIYHKELGLRFPHGVLKVAIFLGSGSSRRWW